MKHTLLSISRYVIVWYANNFAAPFWMIGHYHFAVNNYQQIEQIIGIVSINLITVLGIYLDWRIQHSEIPKSVEDVTDEKLNFFAIDNRCSQREIARSTAMGMKNRGLSLKDIIFTREDETHLYVFYKDR
jgi:hypothetical protein